ncbi:lysophospholipid acyltransferase 1-like [Iris pallida]|uniref:Lysophospholipid acyltransferase 1-like n=1 Tax=Iris pallida TaxID=29817 RepID=A0AAX6GAS4_IRIPA|nr:lysophospholipid acyltransferase 1-like [Iris pallida]
MSCRSCRLLEPRNELPAAGTGARRSSRLFSHPKLSVDIGRTKSRTMMKVQPLKKLKENVCQIYWLLV